MKARRLGKTLGPGSPAAARDRSGGAMASSTGRAMAVPTPLRKVRRGISPAGLAIHGTLGTNPDLHLIQLALVGVAREVEVHYRRSGISFKARISQRRVGGASDVHVVAIRIHALPLERGARIGAGGQS